MSWIAGAIDLYGGAVLPPGTLSAMAEALQHRGPGPGLVSSEGGVHLACGGPEVGAAPDAGPQGGVRLAFDGALTSDHADRPLGGAGLLREAYLAHGNAAVGRLRGQFAFALHDARRRRVLLARDRFGICPLYYARRGDWLLFASEIKGLLASGLVPARADLRGINHAFTFFGVPGPLTCFEGVSSLAPGRLLEVGLDGGAVRERVWWAIDFPPEGEEETGRAEVLVERLEGLLSAAVRRRLAGGGRVASYLSGGADSSLLAALAARLPGGAPPTLTIRIDAPGLDESEAVGAISRRLGLAPEAITVGRAETLAAYPDLVRAAESPVLDTACAALLLLARRAAGRGFGAALTGEGADEWMGSYPWFRAHRWLGLLDLVPGLELGQLARRLFLRLTGAPVFPAEVVRRSIESAGGPNPWLDMYGLVSLSKLRFFAPELLRVMADGNPYADLGLDLARMKRWHPFNRGLALGARAHLPGLLLKAKGDNVARASGLQMRYPFLDEEVFAFLSRLHPSWKARGAKDKYLLRLLAARHLPREVVWKPKALFQAPFEGFHAWLAPPYAEQLCSPESLRKSGYFDAEAVRHWRSRVAGMAPGSAQRTSVDMGLAGVVSTQLWHHLFIAPSLADLPGLAPPGPPSARAPLPVAG